MKAKDIIRKLEVLGLEEYNHHDLKYTKVYCMGVENIRVELHYYVDNYDIHEISISTIIKHKTYHDPNKGIDFIKDLIREYIDP